MISMPPVQIDSFPLEGGLDIVTPPLAIPAGFCREVQNFEIAINGGYKGLDGYERLDGRASPSDAQYAMLPCTVTGTVVSSNAVTGVTSAATATVIAVFDTYLVVTKMVGTFTSSEVLNVSGSPVATMTGDPISNGASSPQLHAQYLNLAADVYRADIQPVPGSGDVLGVVMYQDQIYAFRNNAGGTAAEMYQATAGGWSKINFEYEVAFTNGNASVGEGDTLTQGGVTATIRRVVVRTGTLLSGTNTGILVISAPAGGSFAAGAATSTGGGALTLGGAQSAITLATGGRFEFIQYNFGQGLRLYGCDGVSRAWEFDGTYFVPIPTGMALDTPDHITVHANHLFLSFDNSLQYSSIADPYGWSPVSGAGELNMGESVTNLIAQVGDSNSAALTIYTRNKTFILYGNSPNWTLVTYAGDSGGRAYTAQLYLGQTMVLDDRGVTMVQASQNYGNFDATAVSKRVRPWVIEARGGAVASGISRDKNQYRIFFTGGRALYMTQDGGFMTQLFAHEMTCYHSSENSAGNEVALAGATNGYVYQFDKGTSFDGEPIESYMTLVFNHLRSPRLHKRYRKAVLEVQGTTYAEYWLNADLGYSSTEIEQVPAGMQAITLSSGHWDAGTWDVGVWDGRILAPSEFELSGTAENISIRIAQTSDYMAPLTFHSVMLHYTPRRQLR